MREVGGENTPSAIIAASSKTIDLQYCRNIYQANIINGKVDICNLLHIDDGLYLLGKAVVSKIDEFCISYKFATQFFRWKMTPPPPPPFVCSFIRKFMTESAFSNGKHIAPNFFRSEMHPPPNFGYFPKIHPFLQRQSSLM